MGVERKKKRGGGRRRVPESLEVVPAGGGRAAGVGDGEDGGGEGEAEGGEAQHQDQPVEPPELLDGHRRLVLPVVAVGVVVGRGGGGVAVAG